MLSINRTRRHGSTLPVSLASADGDSHSHTMVSDLLSSCTALDIFVVSGVSAACQRRVSGISKPHKMCGYWQGATVKQEISPLEAVAWAEGALCCPLQSISEL